MCERACVRACVQGQVRHDTSLASQCLCVRACVCFRCGTSTASSSSGPAPSPPTSSSSPSSPRSAAAVRVCVCACVCARARQHVYKAAAAVCMCLRAHACNRMRTRLSRDPGQNLFSQTRTHKCTHINLRARIHAQTPPPGLRPHRVAVIVDPCRAEPCRRPCHLSCGLRGWPRRVRV